MQRPGIYEGMGGRAAKVCHEKHYEGEKNYDLPTMPIL